MVWRYYNKKGDGVKINLEGHFEIDTYDSVCGIIAGLEKDDYFKYLKGKFMRKMFFWIGLFLIVSTSSCALAKPSHKNKAINKPEPVTQSHDEKPSHDKSLPAPKNVATQKLEHDLEPDEEEPEHETKNHDKKPAPHKPSVAGHQGAHWTYEGKTGPKHWGQLSSKSRTCSSGKEQSPINITNGKLKDIENIRYHYKPSKLNVINNGHTIQVNYDPGSFIRIDGEKYELLQFHFHTPSEHTIEGSRYPMELHLVHKNKKGELAVVGIMMVIGKHNNLLNSLWDFLPAKEGKENLKTKIDLAALLPAGERTFRYRGSLTTPPCSEKVRWNVLLAPISISSEQLTTFRDIFERNSRPVQPIRNRTLWEDTSP